MRDRLNLSVSMMVGIDRGHRMYDGSVECISSCHWRLPPVKVGIFDVWRFDIFFAKTTLVFDMGIWLFLLNYGKGLGSLKESLAKGFEHLCWRCVHIYRYRISDVQCVQWVYQYCVYYHVCFCIIYEVLA